MVRLDINKTIIFWRSLQCLERKDVQEGLFGRTAAWVRRPTVKLTWEPELTFTSITLAASDKAMLGMTVGK